MSLWAITGGSGFLGLHLIRRLLAEGSGIRSLDIDPLDDELTSVGVEAIVGDVRDTRATRVLCADADVLVHAAAALPIRGSAASITSVNVDGTATVLAAAAEAAVRRVILISSTAVYGVPTVHPITEDTPLEPLGPYGRSKIESERIALEFARRGLELVILRPKTFLGPERLGVFEILFDWIRDGRRIYTIGSGQNRYQLLAVEDLVEAILAAADRPSAAGTYNIGAAQFGTVADDLQALVDHAGSTSRVTPTPARPVKLMLRVLELARLSPLAAWHYETADKDSYVDIAKAARALSWQPKLSNAETLVAAYDWYLHNRNRVLDIPGVTHRVRWDQKALRFLKRVS
jgi:nucleoside-diphosphate-sugar epimerase